MHNILFVFYFALFGSICKVSSNHNRQSNRVEEIGDLGRGVASFEVVKVKCHGITQVKHLQNVFSAVLLLSQVMFNSET